MRYLVLIFSIVILSSFGILCTNNSNPGYPDINVYGHPMYQDGPTHGDRGDILITEIHWTGTIDNKGKYYHDDIMIEVQNKMERPVDIRKWRLIVEGHTEKTYRIPDDQGPLTMETNEYIVIAKTKEHAFPNADVVISDLYIPKDFFMITLKDLDKRLIESAGNESGEPFAGSCDFYTARSMERTKAIFSNQGIRDVNWHTYFNPDKKGGEANGNLISADFNLRTFGSPGEPNSPDYSGNISGGEYE